MKPANIDLWRRTMQTLPDRVFYDLVRNYIGEFPSPHHKPDLLSRLELLLRQEDFIQTIGLFLDGTDRYVLSMVQWLDGISEDNLFNLVKEVNGLGTYHNYHQRIVNLEDRLWLYVDNEHNLRLCPLLEDILTIDHSDSTRGRESKITPPESSQGHWLGDPFFLALFNTLGQLLPCLKADASLSKKGRELFLRLFTGLGDFDNSDSIAGDLGDFCLSAIRSLGLVRRAENSGTWRPVPQRIKDFFQLDFYSRWFMFVAAACISNNHLSPEQESAAAFSIISEIRELAAFLHAFWLVLEPIFYQQSDLERMWMGLHYRHHHRSPNRSFSSLLTVLQAFGLIRQNANSGQWSLSPLPLSQKTENIRITGAGIVFCTNPDAQLFLQISKCLELERFGRDSRYSLNANRAKEFLGGGGSLADLIVDFGKATGTELATTLAFQLKEWANSATSIMLSGGILLECQGEQADMVAHLAAEQEHVRLLGPNQYFISIHGFNFLEDLIAKGLIDAESVQNAKQGGKSELADILPPLRSMQAPHLDNTVPCPQLSPRNSSQQELALLAVVQEQTWTADQKNEAKQRIKQSLIVHPKQLSSPPRPSEQGRAGGLDFNAKVRLIDEAIKNKNEYVVLKLLGNIDQSELIIWPKQVKGTSNDALLLGHTLPEHQELVLYIRKIIEIRRIRASLFV